jgi:hypothetical protein
MAWSGEHRAFIVEKFIKNGGSKVATQRAFRIRFATGRRDTVTGKKTIYRWVSNFIIDLKRHSVYFPEIKKTFAESFLVLNLLASQIGDFFLPQPVYVFTLHREIKTMRSLSNGEGKVKVKADFSGFIRHRELCSLLYPRP